MKHIGFLFLCLLMGFSASAQFGQDAPVTWEFKATQVEDNIFLLEFTADVESGWYVYSQHIADGGPIPTSFEFEETKGLKLIGQVEEKGKLNKDYDETFGMDLAYFKETVSFQQKVEVSDKIGNAKGYLTFMTCNGATCLPPKDVDFSFNVSR